MSVNRLLTRDDIVGHRVADVLQTEWSEPVGEEPFVSRYCTVVVMLDNRIVFELPIVLLDDPDDRYQGLPAFEGDLSHLKPAEFMWNDPDLTGETREAAVGRAVLDVVVSAFWQSVGLVLDDLMILHQELPVVPGWNGACLTGVPCIATSEDFISYFTRQPLPYFDKLPREEG